MRPALLVAQTGLLGGAERVLLDWSRALERPVVLACPPGPLAAAAAAAGHRVEALPERPLQRRGRTAGAARDLAALARDVRRLARAHHPGVVVASGLRPVLAAAAARPGVPFVTVHHDLAGVPVPLGDAAVATSGAIAARLAGTARRGGWPVRGRRVTVIRPGVDLAHWATVPAPPRHGPPRALWLGALAPWKRPDLALEIAALVPELQLELAGAPLPGDGLPPALRERAARPDLAGRVDLLGPVADPRDALAGAHLLLHTADREPYGLVLLEALAAGRPLVAPAAGGPLELVTPRCGRLYAPGDAVAGAAAVRAVLAGPAAAGAARARAAHFDAAAAAARFSAVVEAAAAGRATPVTPRRPAQRA